MPSVSVIIPSYNGAHFLPRALDSVLAQTHAVTEVFVVDDGSTDNSRDVVESYVSRYPGVVYYEYQANAGPSAARNRGLRLARSEWIALLDADDWWKPEKLARQFAALTERPAATLVYTGVEFHYEDGRTQLQPAKDPDQLLPSLRYMNCIQPSTVLVRRAALLDLGGFNEQVRGIEDWDMWMRLKTISNAQFAAVTAELTCYWIQESSLSHQLDTMLNNERKVVESSLIAGLHGASARIWRRRIWCWSLYRAAMLARDQRDPREAGLLLRSLLEWPSPFFHPVRFKALAVTLGRRLGVLRAG